MSRLIVKDLPKNISEQELRKRFSEKGTVTECSLRYTPEGVFRKFAFVGFKETSEAEDAIKYFNNSFINATKIKVAIAKDFKDVNANVTWSKHSKQKRQDGNVSNKNKEQEVTSSWAIKVTGLPPNVKKNQIEEFFKPLKVFVNIPPNKKVNTKLVVCFENENERDEAMRRNKNFIGSNKIFLHKHTGQPVTISQEVRPQKKDDSTQREDKQQEKAVIAETGRLFVRNLPYCSTDEDLEKLFSQYGPATVELQVDKFRNEQKGFAFINYVMPENALAAYDNLDGTIFQGRMLHILGGKAKKEETQDMEEIPFSKKKEIMKKKSAASAQCWNTLFIGPDALAETVANEEGIEKRDLLMTDGGISVAAKMAIKQTKIVNDIRNFLIKNGVSLDSFRQPSSPRSKSVLLAKNLPAGTSEKDLREVFSEYANSLDKIIIPTNGLTAIIKFNNEVLAKQAFKDLAYSKIKHLPLYLEWAPLDVFSGKEKDKEENETPMLMQEAEVEDTTVEEEENIDVDLSLPRRFVFVKNIPSSSTKEELQELFEKYGKVVSINFIDYNKDEAEVTSAFVEFGLPEFAEACVRETRDIHGQKVELRISDRPGILNTKSTHSELKPGKEEGKETNKILVKNIPFEASLKDLKQLFGNYSGFTNIRLPKKAEGHRGFAFIEFNTKLAAKACFNELCHNTTLFGRRLVLEWSSSSENHASAADVAHLRKRTAENYKGNASKKKRADLLNDLQTGTA